MKVKVLTLGCKVNQFESQAMLRELSENGYEIVGEDDAADVSVINSCAVTKASEQKAVKMIHRLRRENPSSVIVLTGCMAQAFPECGNELPEVDIVLGALLVVQHVLRGVRVDAPLRALVDASRVEEGRLLVAARHIGGQRNRLFPIGRAVRARGQRPGRADGHSENVFHDAQYSIPAPAPQITMSKVFSDKSPSFLV